MKKKVISFILCFIMSISLVDFNKVESKAEDSSIDYSKYYVKNYEEELEDEKYIVVDNDEDLDEMEKYFENWQSAFGISEDIINQRDFDYPYAINFITKNNLKHENIMNILSKYDTKFLFGYTFSDSYLETVIKEACDISFNILDAIKTNDSIVHLKNNSKLYKNFIGDKNEFLEYAKNIMYNKVLYSELFEINKFFNDEDIKKHFEDNNYYDDAEFIAYNQYMQNKQNRKIKLVLEKYIYEKESEYYVRFKTEDDFVRALEEFNNNEYIDIKSKESFELEQIKDNSIIMVNPIIDDKKTLTEENKVDEVKKELIKYDINYTIYSSSTNPEKKTTSFLIILSDIKIEEFHEVFSIVKNLVEKNRTKYFFEDENKLYKDLYIARDRCFVSINRASESFFEKYLEEKVPTKYFKIRNNNSKYTITNNIIKFFDELNEESVIYPVVDIELKTIYRLYNRRTGEHLFTSKKSEYDKLEEKGWTKEGETFNGCNDKDAKGVYRVYNPNAKGGDHHYTMSQKEAEKLVKKGWKWDNNGNPLFYAAGDKKVYRLYNKVDGRHHYTPKVKEKEKLVGLGWVDEGVAWDTLESTVK